MDTLLTKENDVKTIPIHIAFKAMYTTKRRYILLTGGRGSLKSSTTHDFVVRLSYEAGHGILFTRYILRSANDSIIPEFRACVQRLGVEGDFHITADRATNKTNGSFILFRGINTSSGDQTANLKSIHGITTWVVEEGEDFQDEAKFNIIDDSVRSSEKQNRVIWIMNPTTKEHFVYQKWIRPKNKQKVVHGFNVTMSNDDEVEHIHTTYHIAEELKYLPKDWLSKANRYLQELNEEIAKCIENWTRSEIELANELNIIRHDSHYYKNYIGGWRERAEGVIFDNWIEGKFNERLPSVYGLDWGYAPDPLGVVRVAVDRKQRKIYLKEYIYETELDDVENQLNKVGISKTALIVCDTNEGRTIKRLQKNGYNLQKAVKNIISEDIREIKQYLIIVDPNSDNLKSELNNYEWNDKKSDVPIDSWNHLLDAFRYGFRRLVKRKVGLRRRN